MPAKSSRPPFSGLGFRMLRTAQQNCIRRNNTLRGLPLVISGRRFAQRRLYNSTVPRNAPAAATATKPATDSEGLLEFFTRPKPLTILPSPLPVGAPQTVENLHYFPDGSTLDRLAIMEACLSNEFDIKRAEGLFLAFRKDEQRAGFLDIKVYNRFLKAYFDAARKEVTKPEVSESWRKASWDLYRRMEANLEPATPDATTYAIMLYGLLNTPRVDTYEREDVTAQMVESIRTRLVPLSTIVASPIFQGEEAAAAVQLLARSAASAMPRAEFLRNAQELGIAVENAQDPLDNVPEVIMHTKRVIGPDGKEDLDAVPEIPFNLGVLQRNLHNVLEERKALPEDVLRRQKLLEESVYESAMTRFRHEAETCAARGGSMSSRSLQAWMWDWHVKLEENLKAKLEKLRNTEPTKKEWALSWKDRPKARLVDFMQLLPVEKISLVTVMEIIRLQGEHDIQEGIKTTRTLLGIGKAIEMEHHFQSSKANDVFVPDLRTELSTRSIDGFYALHKRRVQAKLEQEGRDSWLPEWTHEVRVMVGGFVVDALMESARIIRNKVTLKGELLEEEQPAFINTYRFEHGHKIGVIKLNELVIEKMSQEPMRGQLHARHLPMLVQPQPWLTHSKGGYLYSKTSVMRYKESNEQFSYLKEADGMGALELIYACLDILGKTPWKINEAVFNVALQVWNEGLEYPRIPPKILVQRFPDIPDNMNDIKIRSAYTAAMKNLSHERSSHHSDRCSVNYKMEIARTFLGERFHLPHNIDFRGRAYPIPPHLNHMGDDLSRGFLLFADGRPLGERGLRWLKIHLANVFGYDKAPFDDRAAFVMERINDVFDSAENPLTGRQWWLRADDPWQCLATCMELTNALKAEDPYSFVSHLPVHQDGTCNGLQHYAALGGDAVGAKQVNLDVTDRPSDIYTYVAQMVETELKKEAEGGDELASRLVGKIARKVVKQTVMTTVYGVTFIGAREQIAKQLKTLEDTNLDRDQLWKASGYLATLTLDCIGNLFSGAKDIQNWLNACARLVSKSIPEERVRLMLQADNDRKSPRKGKVERPKKTETTLLDRTGKEQMTTVIWTTMLGLPVVQPYRKAGKRQIMTSLQSVYLSDPNRPLEVHPIKQVTAFPPNFVHSLDATHMMLTALECDRRDITFASVHDSYWTHASTVDEMSVMIRSTFIHLHSSDVMQNLLEEFRERYKDFRVPLKVLESKKFDKAHLPAHIRELLNDSSPPEEDSSADDAKPKRVRKKRSLTTIPKTSDVSDSDSGLSTEPPPSDAIEHQMQTRFVKLTEVLPPIPKKGKFDIELIKDSPYFFS